MNVFVLCTGRCGSTTFAKACKHITNYTASHESKRGICGNARLRYSENHIEVDNRLSWFLGGLDERYGNNAFYVHLIREESQVVESFVKRWNQQWGIMYVYRIILNFTSAKLNRNVVFDYYNTVNSNIRFFLRDKTNKMDFHLELAKEDFPRFWNMIGAKGNLEAALKEFDIKYNKSK